MYCNRMNRYTLAAAMACMFPLTMGKESIDDLLGGEPKAKAAKKATKAVVKKAAKAPAVKKAVKKASGTKAERGTGKFYMSADEKAKIGVKVLAALKGGPKSTGEMAEKFGVPSFKVRLAAVVLEDEKKVTCKQEGNQLTWKAK